jgi:hypothetical protein
MKEISLVIENEEDKNLYFNTLRVEARIPICKSCGKFFQFGFPNDDEGICDFLICQENYLICECEYHTMVRKLMNQKEDGVLDISPYYVVKDS